MRQRTFFLKTMVVTVSVICFGFMLSGKPAFSKYISRTTWPFQADSGIVASPRIADLDQDGYLETVIFDGESVYVINPDGQLQRKISIDPPEGYEYFDYADLSIADADNDGELEIILKANFRAPYDEYSYCQRAEVYSFSPFGEKNWVFEAGYAFGADSNPIVMDVDKDAKNEVIIPVRHKSTPPECDQFLNDSEGALYVVEVVDGAPVVEYLYEDQNIDNNSTGNYLTVADVDGDQDMEVLGYFDGILKALSFDEDAGEYVTLWEKDGVSGMPVVRVDEDPITVAVGQSEPGGRVLVTLDGATGQELSGIDLMDYAIRYVTDRASLVRTPVFADITGNGIKDAIFAAGIGNNGLKKLFAVNGFSSEMIFGEGHSPYISDWPYYITTGDLYENGDPYFLYSTWEKVVVHDQTRQIVGDFPVAYYNREVPLADLDQDGQLEIFYVDKDILHVIHRDGQPFIFTGSMGSSFFNPMAWPVFRHDPQRSGNCNFLGINFQLSGKILDITKSEDGVGMAGVELIIEEIDEPFSSEGVEVARVVTDEQGVYVTPYLALTKKNYQIRPADVEHYKFLSFAPENPDAPVVITLMAEYFNPQWVEESLDFKAYQLEPQPAELISPDQDVVFSTHEAMFEWGPGVGVDQYYLYVGTSQGSGNICGGSQGLNTSKTVTDIPLYGDPIYVRLWSHIEGGTWEYRDYSFGTEAIDPAPEPAEMISPEDGATLTSSTVTFEWNEGLGVNTYYIFVGTSVGNYDLGYGFGNEGYLSKTYTNIPQDGNPIYVRLYSIFNGTVQYKDYVYQTKP